MPRLTVVVPCYNEADRLAPVPLLAYLDAHAEASLLLVNDGSTDATGALLDRIAGERPGRIRALQLTPNRGKAEAVPPLPLRAIVEVPLTVWHDVSGSKLGVGGMARTLRDLALVARDMAARRKTMRNRENPAS